MPKTIQFKISSQFSFIWRIERTLSVANTLGQGTMAMKGYSKFPKAPASLEPHNQIVYCQIQHNRLEGVLLYSVYSTAPPDWASSENL